jgi:SulP family sulfate permease
MFTDLAFHRREFAGSLGDLGTLLPIAIAMVLINGLDPLGVFFSIGVYYIVAGLYFRLTVPVQPMKVIGAYAIATAMSAEQILASSLLMGVFLLLIGATGAIDIIRKWTPKSTIRGVQLATGVLLMSGGVKFILGTSNIQALHGIAEPYLTLQAVGPLPIGVIIGILGFILTLFLLDNRRSPAGLVVVAAGLTIGLVLGKQIAIWPETWALHLPQFMPLPFPAQADFSFALLILVLPQLPMTLGNAVIAYTDLSREYFGERADRLTNRKACISMALANIFSFALGGMPMCHGAGGLAAHYRFGARTAGSNIMIGVIFLLLVLGLGNNIVDFFNLLPMSILGVLLVFAGAQLALTVMDLESRKDFFVAILILGITLAANLAAGFIVGIATAHLLRWEKLSI